MKRSLTVAAVSLAALIGVMAQPAPSINCPAQIGTAQEPSVDAHKAEKAAIEQEARSPGYHCWAEVNDHMEDNYEVICMAG